MTIDLSTLPAKVTVTNNSTTKKKVNISGINQSFPIEAGDSVILRAETSSELIGYLSQETDDLSVSYEAVTDGQLTN